MNERQMSVMELNRELKYRAEKAGVEIQRLRTLLVEYTAYQYKEHNPEGLQCDCRMCGDIRKTRAAMNFKMAEERS